MASWRTAGILWLIAGLGSAFLIPFMTDPLMLAVYAIGAVVGLALGVASFIRRSDRLASLAAAVGAVWLVAHTTVVLLNLSGPVEYLVLPIIVTLAGAAAGWVSFLVARRTPMSQG